MARWVRTHKAYEGRLSLDGGREVEVRVLGRAEGRPGLVTLTVPEGRRGNWFHSPALDRRNGPEAEGKPG